MQRYKSNTPVCTLNVNEHLFHPLLQCNTHVLLKNMIIFISCVGTVYAHFHVLPVGSGPYVMAGSG